MIGFFFIYIVIANGCEVTMFVSLKKQNVIRHLNFSFQTPSWFLGGYLKRKIS